MKKIYISFPGSDGPEEAAQNARAYCQYAIEQGYAPFCPYLQYSQLFMEDHPGNSNLQVNMGIEFLKSCDELWIFCSTRTNAMMQEIRYATEHNIPVQYKSHARALHLDMYYTEDCIEQSKYNADYFAQILVVNPDLLKDEYRCKEHQLWMPFAKTFGCDPKSSGRAIYAVDLYDGQKGNWRRTDFLGILKPDRIPDFVAAKGFYDQYAHDATEQVPDDELEL